MCLAPSKILLGNIEGVSRGMVCGKAGDKGGGGCREATAVIGCCCSMTSRAAQEEGNILSLLIYFCHCFSLCISSVHPFLIPPFTSLFAHPSEFRLVGSVSFSLIKTWEFLPGGMSLEAGSLAQGSGSATKDLAIEVVD